MTKPRVAILGAGAMGTLFAYQLAEKSEVTLVDVRADAVAPIVADGGVQLESRPRRSVAATLDPARAFTANFVFVFVKAPNTFAAIRPFARKLNPATPVISLQNGLGNEEAIKGALGNVALVIGITDVAAFLVRPGCTRPQGNGAASPPTVGAQTKGAGAAIAGTTVLGSAGASTETVRAVRDLLTSAQLDCSVAYDIRPHQWGKLLANAAINPIAALAAASNAIVAADHDAAELARKVALEGAAVARALRINLPFADPWDYVRGIVAATANNRNSMTVDLETGNKTEIDAVNGAIVAAGAQHGVATPYNESLLHLIRTRQRTAR